MKDEQINRASVELCRLAQLVDRPGHRSKREGENAGTAHVEIVNRALVAALVRNRGGITLDSASHPASWNDQVLGPRAIGAIHERTDQGLPLVRDDKGSGRAVAEDHADAFV